MSDTRAHLYPHELCGVCKRWTWCARSTDELPEGCDSDKQGRRWSDRRNHDALYDPADDPWFPTLVVPLPVAVAALRAYAGEIADGRGYGLEAGDVAGRLELLAGLLERAKVRSDVDELPPVVSCPPGRVCWDIDANAPATEGLCPACEARQASPGGGEAERS